jgi:hypothetical protein
MMPNANNTRARNPTAWAAAIANSQPTPAADVTRIMVSARMSYERLKQGDAPASDFERLAAVLNVGLIRGESIGAEVVEAMKLAMEAILECHSLHQRHGRWGFTGPGIQAMNEALELYEQILGASSPNQMEAAVKESYRRMVAGQYHATDEPAARAA